jgi:RNA polymerase sigma-70 factor (ECF subfamily)
MTMLRSPHDPDAQDLHDFVHGDQRAFDRILQRNFPRMFKFIVRYVRSAQAAEDLTQDVFLKAYKHAHTFNPDAKFSTWLFTIARNLSLNYLRKEKRIVFSLDDQHEDGEAYVHSVEADPDHQPDQAVIQQDTAKMVREAIDRLPDQQRVAVLLRRYEGLSYEDIAATMGTTLSAVKSLLNRAKRALHDDLKDRMAG